MDEKKKRKEVDYWTCKYCGSSDCWFDRSITCDEKGNELEGMGYVCNKCGRKEL